MRVRAFVFVIFVYIIDFKQLNITICCFGPED